MNDENNDDYEWRKKMFSLQAYTLYACYLLKYACLSIRNFHHKSLNANYYYRYKCIYVH